MTGAQLAALQAANRYRKIQAQMKRDEKNRAVLTHTCNPEDRREGQHDADCLRCQQIVARWAKS
jgi:hypothetical protein